MLEELKNGCLALENLELPIQHRLKRNGGMGKISWKILKVFLKTIFSILLGDPTVVFSLLADLAIN